MTWVVQYFLCDASRKWEPNLALLHWPTGRKEADHLLWWTWFDFLPKQLFTLGFNTLRKWKWLSRVWLFVTQWLYSPWNSPGQNTGVDNLSLLQGNLPKPGIEPRSPTLQADSLPAEPQGKPECLCFQAAPFKALPKGSARGWLLGWRRKKGPPCCFFLLVTPQWLTACWWLLTPQHPMLQQ